MKPFPLTISGFGMTYNASDPAKGWYNPTHLSVANIKFLNLSRCYGPTKELELTFPGHFCAGAGLGKRDFAPDSCQGDSGGPATYE